MCAYGINSIFDVKCALQDKEHSSPCHHVHIQVTQQLLLQSMHEETQTKHAGLVDPLNTQFVEETSPDEEDVQQYRAQMTIQFVTELSCETAQWHKDSARNSCDFSRYNNSLYLSRMPINAKKGPRHWTPMPWSLRKRWKIEE